MMQKLLIALFLISLANISCNSKSGKRNVGLAENTTTITNDYFNVTKIVDGDTFWIDDGTKKGEKIRLIGVDAPESRNMWKIKKEDFGVEAKEYMIELLKEKKVRLEYDVGKLDRYGRTLAYVYLLDGTFVNAELVKNGYAMVMTVPPNVKYADKFVEYQQEARQNNRGLWSVKTE